ESLPGRSPSAAPPRPSAGTLSKVAGGCRPPTVKIARPGKGGHTGLSANRWPEVVPPSGRDQVSHSLGPAEWVASEEPHLSALHARVPRTLSDSTKGFNRASRDTNGRSGSSLLAYRGRVSFLLCRRLRQPEHVLKSAGEDEVVRAGELLDLFRLDVGEEDLGLGDQVVAGGEGPGHRPADVANLLEGGRVGQGLTGPGLAVEDGLWHLGQDDVLLELVSLPDEDAAGLGQPLQDEGGRHDRVPGE